jgi:hypothetical protein
VTVSYALRKYVFVARICFSSSPSDIIEKALRKLVGQALRNEMMLLMPGNIF